MHGGGTCAVGSYLNSNLRIYAISRNVSSHYNESHYAYVESRYAESHYAERSYQIGSMLNFH